MPTADDGLRKSVVFLARLDPQTADALLDQLSPSLADQVRSALAQLESVEHEEAERIADEFLQINNRVPNEVKDAVEINPSLVERLARGEDEEGLEEDLAGSSADPATAEPGAGFSGFLHQFTTEDLTRFCDGEHPQTASVILAHLPPGRAAETLHGLSSSLQGTILRRMAHLSEVDANVLHEIRQQMLASLPRMPVRHAPPAPPRLSSVEAILEVFEEQQRQSLLETLGRADQRMAQSLGLDATPAPPVDPEPMTIPLPRPAEEEEPDASLQFEDLAVWDDATLSKLFQYADPRIVLLALAGASSQLIDRLLVRLPVRDARSLRRRITELAPTRLSDIEQAQAQLIVLAMRLDREGTIRLPHLRRFITAA